MHLLRCSKWFSLLLWVSGGCQGVAMHLLSHSKWFLGHYYSVVSGGCQGVAMHLLSRSKWFLEYFNIIVGVVAKMLLCTC